MGPLVACMDKKMSGNAELLNFIYQNSQMGVDTIKQLLDMIEEEDFKKQLEKQLEGYQGIHKEAKEMLNNNGFDEKEVGTFNKIRTYLMINIQTLTDKSTSHIAEMMIEGSNMGIVDATKRINQYEDAEKDILHLMEKLRSFEESNLETLKNFL